MPYIKLGGIVTFSKEIEQPIYSCSIKFQKLLSFIKQIESDLPKKDALSLHTKLKDGSSKTFYSITDFEESETIQSIGIESLNIYYNSEFSIRLDYIYSKLSYESTSRIGHSIINFAIDSLNLNKGSWLNRLNSSLFGYLIYSSLAIFSLTYNATTYGSTFYLLVNAIFSFLLLFFSLKNDQKVKIIMKNNTDSLLIRKKEDLIANTIFTIIGAGLGYFISKL